MFNPITETNSNGFFATDQQKAAGLDVYWWCSRTAKALVHRYPLDFDLTEICRQIIDRQNQIPERDKRWALKEIMHMVSEHRSGRKLCLSRYFTALRGFRDIYLGWRLILVSWVAAVVMAAVFPAEMATPLWRTFFLCSSGAGIIVTLSFWRILLLLIRREGWLSGTWFQRSRLTFGLRQ